MTYLYRRVGCTNCKWRGKRSYTTAWAACPKCLGRVIPLECGPEAAELLQRHEAMDKRAEETAKKYEAEEREMLAELKAKYEPQS